MGKKLGEGKRRGRDERKREEKQEKWWRGRENRKRQEGE